MSQTENSFSYTYSANEQREVEKIIKKYAPEENKIERLKSLDRAVTLPGQITSITIGVIGALVFGLGLTFCLDALNVAFVSDMLLGTVLVLVGTSVMAISYPIYSAITKKQRNKLAPQILKLSEEILGRQ